MDATKSEYDFNSFKFWQGTEENKIQFNCGNTSLRRFCVLTLQGNKPREYRNGQLYRDPAYSGPADDTLGPLYLYLYGIIHYTRTKRGKERVQDVYHVLMPFKDFHDVFSDHLFPEGKNLCSFSPLNVTLNSFSY